jgi:hypothetical protein
MRHRIVGSTQAFVAIAAFFATACGGVSEQSSEGGGDEESTRAASETPGVASPSKVDWDKRGEEAPYSLVANPDPRRLRMRMPMAPPPMPPRERERSAAEHRGHQVSDNVEKPARTASDATTLRQVTPPPAEYVAKQRTYLEQARASDAKYAALPEAERNARRAALKRTVLGE